MHRAFALFPVLAGGVAFAADGPIPSAPVVSIAQAAVGDVRLVAWETTAGIETQALDAATHSALPGGGRVSLGVQIPQAAQPRVGQLQTRPAIAGLSGSGGDAIFLVAWQAELLDANGNSVGTEIVGQRVFVDDLTHAVSVDPLLRISRVDDDGNPSAASEARSAPLVVANAGEDEFLVLWTHWPAGKSLNGNDPPTSSDGLFIYGQEIDSNGVLTGETAIQLDNQPAPTRNGAPERHDHNVMFLAAAANADAPGYLLAWSDPAQESADNPAQVYTKALPGVLADTATSARNPIAQSTHILHGTGRLALAPLPQNAGFLLAWEDARSTQPLRGMLLDTDGKPVSETIKLLDLVQPGDDAFLSPRLVGVPGKDRMLLYAVVGTYGISEMIDERFVEPARLVRRVLDPTSAETLAFISNFSDIETDAAYPSVNVAFANLAHDAGSLPDGKGAVSFTASAETAEVIVSEFLFEDEPPPPPPPGNGGNADDNGGGAMFLLLFLLPLLRPARTLAVLGGLMFATAAGASSADLELLHTARDGNDCYRSVMYREVSEIRMGNSWGKTPIPAGTPVEVVDLPSGWSAEVITERNYQYIRFKPSAFDTVTGISIGRLCLKFPPMSVAPEAMSYTYDLVATRSAVMATARPDDGVSDDELRAMIKRGERLKQRDLLDKPRQLDESMKTLKRAKDLFD